MPLQIKRENIGYIQIFIAGILWGLIGPFILILDYYGSTFIVSSFLRMFFSTIILFTITILKFKISVFNIKPKTLFLCALLGLICHGINNLFYGMAILLTGVTVSAILMNTAPIFTIIFAYFLFKEKITSLKITAILFNIIGCILVSTDGYFSIENLSILGIICGLGTGLCYGMTAIIGKLAADKTNIFVLSTYSYLFASIFLYIYMVPLPYHLLSNPTILFTGFLYALFPTAIAYILYYNGLLKMKETSKVPVIASVEAIMATIIGVLFFNEQLLLPNYLGIALVIFSILLINYSPFKLKVS